MSKSTIIIFALLAINAPPCFGFEVPVGFSCNRFSFATCTIRSTAPIRVGRNFHSCSAKPIFYDHGDKSTTASNLKPTSRDDSALFDDEFSFGSSGSLEDASENTGGGNTPTMKSGADGNLDRVSSGAQDFSQLPIDLPWSSPRTKRPRSAASVRSCATVCWYRMTLHSSVKYSALERSTLVPLIPFSS